MWGYDLTEIIIAFLLMAAHNIVFEQVNKSSHTETTNSFTRAARDVVFLCKLRRIVVSFLLALIPFPVENAFHFDLKIISTARNRNYQKKIRPCELRCLILKFSHEISPVVFTGECIFPEGTKLELVDAATGQHMRHGPLASAQIEIFLLNGDENWTIEELNSHIMMKKRGGKSRRDQNPYLRLEGGVVSVDELKFKHSPKRMKKLEMVTIGAKVVDQPEDVIVKEAVTGPFALKDKRLLRNKKRYPPSATDDVWRLEHIYINGAFHNRLIVNGIKTVEDFLIEFQNNPQRLRHILGKSMSESYWKKATTHAKTCNIDGRKYLYYHLETEQKFAVVFNVAGQVIWLVSGCGLHHFHILTESKKAYARNLVETAFSNWENVLKFDNEILIMHHLLSTKFSPSPCPAVDDFQHSDQLQLTSHAESDGMSLDIPVPVHTTTPNQITSVNSDLGDHLEKIKQLVNSDAIEFEDSSHGEPNHSGLGTWGYLESPSDITSMISDSGGWEEFMQFVNSDAIELEDSDHSAAETSTRQFHGLQHGESIMDFSQYQFTQLMVSENGHTDDTNTNQWREMEVSMVPMATACKGKSKKSWAKISSILKWLLLKKSVKLKKVNVTRKRKFS
ncbi:hypothetical protein HAX54_032894 [Datura stramonium]|uniref:Calmodulin-binding protein 60 A-like n=1 Tax=Datura stramonium TaxID=4076 RepID=A0ABS8RN56_DATST|nr:hypothetical protein [Datura stramonium]